MLIGFRQPELVLISEQNVENMFVSQTCGKPHVGSMYHYSLFVSDTMSF
jgi:hypothetical protein